MHEKYCIDFISITKKTYNIIIYSYCTLIILKFNKKFKANNKTFIKIIIITLYLFVTWLFESSFAANSYAFIQMIILYIIEYHWRWQWHKQLLCNFLLGKVLFWKSLNGFILCIHYYCIHEYSLSDDCFLWFISTF